MEKLHLTGLTRTELADFVNKSRRAEISRDARFLKDLHERRALDFDEMTDLPKAFREKLDEIAATATTLKVESRYVSEDGTRRFLMKTHDNLPVETVFIPTENRDTICFSSQSGCPLKCDFCLTAKLGLLEKFNGGRDCRADNYRSERRLRRGRGNAARHESGRDGRGRAVFEF